MIRATIAIIISALMVGGTSAQSWYDLTVHNATFSGSNFVSGIVHPVGVLPTLTEFHEAEQAIADAMAASTGALSIALAASNAAARAAADVADITSNGMWEVVFTLSALSGVGAADDIISKTVGFTTETTPTNRLCHIAQWFSHTPSVPPEFDCAYTTNLITGFETISVANSYPTTIGLPTDFGQTGGAVYRITVGVPLAWGQAFFKLESSGFVLRGNALPIVGGVAGGVHQDVTVLDAIGLTNVVLHIRGGFAVDTNNPLTLLMLEVM